MAFTRKIKSKWQQFIKILRDPVWTFTSCLVTAILGIVGLVGLSGLIASLTGKFQIILSWLLTPIFIYRIYTILSGALLFVILLFIFIRLFINRKSNSNKARTIPKNYQSQWGVLWKREIGLDGSWIDGPFCPEHKFQLEINYDNNEKRYFFDCAGLPQKGRHTIQGPLIDNLIRPEDRGLIDSYSGLLTYDVEERIKASLRSEGKL